MQVTIPAEDVTIGDWSGTGYIIMNPETGAGSFMISGGLNGGAVDVIVTLTFLIGMIASIADVGVLLYITALALLNLPFLSGPVVAEICFTTILAIIMVIDMARELTEDYYDYWETGDEREFDSVAEKTMWLGFVLLASGIWAYYMDELNQIGMGSAGNGGSGGSEESSAKTFMTGKEGEQELINMYGGKSQAYFKTSMGGRYVDQLADGIAHESKVGYTTLTSRIRLQILKDAELIKTGQIAGAHWHFFQVVSQENVEHLNLCLIC